MGPGLAILGAILSLAGGHTQHRYWWPAMNVCNVATYPPRCVALAGHWATVPPPKLAGVPAASESPGAMCGPVYCRTGKPDF